MKQIPRNLIKHLEWDPNPQPTTASPTTQPAQNPSGGSINVTRDFSKYIQVGISGLNGQRVVISPYELEGYNKHTYDDAHEKLLDNGLYMPTPKIFMAHFMNVVDAHKNRRKLLYADGDEVPDPEVKKMYKHMTENYLDVYSAGEAGVWTWLNARFVEGTGFRDLNVETVVGKLGRKFKTTSVPLEECVEQDCVVDLNFNDQGLAKEKYSKQEYQKGKNIFFWYPRKDNVAGFVADSGRAALYCDWDPSYSHLALGVFGCAEGASARKIGGSK